MNGHTCREYIFRSCNIYFQFQCCVSIKILSHESAKNKTETVKGFKICTFIGRFQVRSWHLQYDNIIITPFPPSSPSPQTLPLSLNLFQIIHVLGGSNDRITRSCRRKLIITDGKAKPTISRGNNFRHGCRSSQG